MWQFFLVLPYFCTLAAIGADVNILPALQDQAPELNILRVAPDFLKGFAFEIAKLVFGILVETAGHDQSVPGDDRGMPKPPAMVVQGILENCPTVFFPPVATEFFVERDQSVRIVCIIIDLGRLEPDLVDAGLFCEPANIVHLVFIGPDNEELKEDKGLFTI